MAQSLIGAAQQGLVKLGWYRLGGIALAGKDFQTAVGVKQALIYSQFGSDHSVQLTGAYYSEGRNVLSTTFVNLHKKMTDQELAAAVQQFEKEVNSVVGESYAARLYRNRVKHDA